MNLTEDQIAERTPLWCALSDLFLDTELQDEDFTRISDVMKRTPYELNEIEQILREEIFPICIPNMFCIAGEWAGFDEEWLVSSILKKKEAGMLSKIWTKGNFGMIRKDWEAILTKYKSEPVAAGQRR